ncbi:MAG: hypothetical protein K6G83_02790 [Lachnospiraceae bacterium]|nr:hypothetical protein [Lachnospiraceae bacterium]
MKKRIGYYHKYIALMLAVLLTFQTFSAVPACAADIAQDEQTAVSETVPDPNTEIPDQTGGSETAPGSEEAPAQESMPSEGKDEEAAPQDTTEEEAIPVEEVIPQENASPDPAAEETVPEEKASEEKLPEEGNGSGTFDAEGTAVFREEAAEVTEAAETEQTVDADLLSAGESNADATLAVADVTVMAYMVGSNLEGDSMAATLDICEIMEGISISQSSGKDVHFIIETGGVDTDKKNRSRADIIADGKKNIETNYPNKKDAYTTRYTKITTGNNKISWLKNERWEVYADELKKAAKIQPSDADRYMTVANSENVQPELAEFIQKTREQYPARQYMLILWDHGGGPAGGLGHDERDPNESTFQAWHIAPTLEKAGIKNGEKFAYVNYDACLMGNLENALVWAPYAHYYCGSEDLEPGDGDFYENWVSLLYQETDKPEVDFSNETQVANVMQRIGEKNVDDFYTWYDEVKDRGTKSLIKLSESSSLSTALSAYAKRLSELFEVDPLEAYYGTYCLRNRTQDFGGRDFGIMDLRDFVTNMDERFTAVINQELANNSEIKTAVLNFKNAGNELLTAMGKAVVKHRETTEYDLYKMGGLTVYLPYLTAPERIEEYFTGYSSIQATDGIKDYRNFVGTFCAIQEAGKLVKDNNKGQDAIAAALSAALKKYGVTQSSSLSRVSGEITGHRLQKEGMKIHKDSKTNKYYYSRRNFKLVYEAYQGPKIDMNGKTHYLGYLAAGAFTVNGDLESQELTNYGEKKWFGFKTADNKYVPVAVCRIDSGYTDTEKKVPGDPFSTKTYLEVPVLYEGKLSLLDVEFAQNSSEGSILGLWPFDFASRTYGRYIKADELKNKKITPLADVPNELEGEIENVYDKDNPAGSCGFGIDITVTDSTKLSRGITLCAGGTNTLAISGTMEMRYFMRDMFGALYPFETLKETVEGSLITRDDQKPKGSSLSTGDIGMKLTGQKGETYNDSEYGKQLPLYYYDVNGNKVPLTEIDGEYYEEDKSGQGQANSAADGLSLASAASEKRYKKFILQKDTKIYAEADQITIGNFTKIDGATEDLEKYFTLKNGVLEILIRVADVPGEGQGQFVNKSKPYAKQAMLCDIKPVTYTGKNLLTTQSTANGSKVIDLVLYDEDGKSILREGIDYSVSYKNNKNAADMTQSRNVPTLTIKGKGDYAGMKYVAKYTIQKASMSDVTLTFERHFVPLSAKGLSLTATAVTPAGAKIPSGNIKLHYYDLDGNEISQQKFADAYRTGQAMIPFTVKAEALSKAKNFETGSFSAAYPANDVLYAFPKSKGSFSVSLYANKVNLNDQVSGYSFFTQNFKKAVIGKTALGIGDLQFYGVYTDSKFINPVENDMLTNAGTCYIAVSLNPANQKLYGNYSVRALKVSVSGGKKLKKSNVSMEASAYPVRLDQLAETPIPVTLKFSDSFNWDRLTLTCSTRNGGSIVKTIKVSDLKDKKLTLSNIDNSAPGTYTIQIKGAGRSTGSLKLTYKIRR